VWTAGVAVFLTAQAWDTPDSSMSRDLLSYREVDDNEVDTSSGGKKGAKKGGKSKGGKSKGGKSKGGKSKGGKSKGGKGKGGKSKGGKNKGGKNENGKKNDKHHKTTTKMHHRKTTKPTTTLAPTTTISKAGRCSRSQLYGRDCISACGTKVEGVVHSGNLFCFITSNHTDMASPWCYCYNQDAAASDMMIDTMINSPLHQAASSSTSYQFGTIALLGCIGGIVGVLSTLVLAKRFFRRTTDVEIHLLA
jgi:hypothetical protein